MRSRVVRRPGRLGLNETRFEPGSIRPRGLRVADFAADAFERLRRIGTGAKQVVFLVFAVDLFEYGGALTDRRDDQRGHLDERDRPDQVEAVMRRASHRAP